MASLTYRIATGTTFITLANIFIGIFNLLSFIVIVRILNKFEYGLIVLALSAINIASTFLDLGIRSVIIADVSREKSENRYDRAKTLLYRYSQIVIIVGLMFFIIIFLLEPYFEQKYTNIVGELVKISSFLIITNAGKNIFMTTFSSNHDFISISKLNAGESFFKLIYIILLGYYFEYGIYGVMLAYPLSSMTSLFLILPNYINIIKDYLHISRSKENFFLKTIKSHGKWAIGIFTLKNLSSNIPPWIIQFFLGVESVAIFNVAIRPVAYINSLLSPLEKVLMPVISQEIRNVERVNKIVNRSIKYSLWLSIPIIVIGIAFSTPVFKVLFGEDYLESAGIFNILIFMSLVYAINLTMRPVFYAFRAQKGLFMITFINIFILCILGIILTLIFRLYGIALAFLINGVFAYLLRHIYIKRIGICIKPMEFIKIDEYDKKLAYKVKIKLQRLI
jgi:O-antigen/teichoic acid export membrane protein